MNIILRAYQPSGQCVTLCQRLLALINEGHESVNNYRNLFTLPITVTKLIDTINAIEY